MAFMNALAYPKDARAFYQGKSVVVRWASGTEREIEFVPAVAGEPATKKVSVTDLRSSKSSSIRYAPLADTTPESEPTPTAATPTPSQTESGLLPPLPDTAPAADTPPVDVPQPFAELQALREQMGRLEREKAQAENERDDALETLRESIATLTRMKAERDEKVQEASKLREALQFLMADQSLQATLPAAPLHREYRIETEVNEATLEALHTDGWTVETMQFTDSARNYSADLNIVAWRKVSEPATPPQPDARASITARLTADFVRESITPTPHEVDTEIDPEPVLHLNKQPDTQQRTDEFYQRRSRIVGKKKAGNFIARQNTLNKRERLSKQELAQELADAGMPVAAQIVATGVDETKAILNAQVYDKAKAAYDAAVANFTPSQPLLSALVTV